MEQGYREVRAKAAGTMYVAISMVDFFVAEERRNISNEGKQFKFCKLYAHLCA